MSKIVVRGRTIRVHTHSEEARRMMHRQYEEYSNERLDELERESRDHEQANPITIKDL